MPYAIQKLKTLLASAASITLLLACPVVAASQLHLLVTGNDSPDLPLYIAIYPASAKGWDGEPILLMREPLPETATMAIGLDIPPGDYAVRAFIDQDGNGELNLNRRGHPAEPYASSLSPDRTRHSQRFEHALITLSANQPSVSLALVYPRKRDD